MENFCGSKPPEGGCGSRQAQGFNPLWQPTASVFHGNRRFADCDPIAQFDRFDPRTTIGLPLECELHVAASRRVPPHLSAYEESGSVEEASGPKAGHAAMDLRRLIEEVRVRPALWDQNHQHRHNHGVLDVLWEDVAKLFNMSPEETRKKWKGLRDTFRRELRKCPNGFEEDLSEDDYPQWVFFKHLMFLKGQMKARRRGEYESVYNGSPHPVNVKEEPADEDSEDVLNPTDNVEQASLEPIVSCDCDTPRDLGSRGVKRPALDELYAGDEDYHFFLSLLPHVRKLSPERKLLVRSRLQALVCSEVYGDGRGDRGDHRNRSNRRQDSASAGGGAAHAQQGAPQGAPAPDHLSERSRPRVSVVHTENGPQVVLMSPVSNLLEI
ncbi:Transcription factor Adf-1 [Frankliniella fusca]|uniref:Transcription factor Adf-1 n=1 Tax=Frankliniella fusca TaxID=407009 RepID=A0AAE1LLY5_9NEOP|nr:Transcription factor Adf-1 [Frankliniella fusca]